MKLKNILVTGFVALAMVSCDDFLSVDAPSSYTEEFVFSQMTEANRALNGVYASILVGDLYGDNYQGNFNLNSDVEMQMYTDDSEKDANYRSFNCTSKGSHIQKFWNAAYNAIEYANRFIHGLETSPLYDENDSEIMQMLGEAKCLRAMVYHDMVVMFGDIPFTFTSASQQEQGYVIPVADREEIQKQLIEDLKAIAPKMTSSATTTVERCNREFANALIARIALTAGGYSLRPDKSSATSYGTMQRSSNYQEFYGTAQEYAKKVIDGGTHQLTASYRDVFVKPSNFELVGGDDVIFEIPFAKESTGNTGYIHGPKSDSYEGQTTGKNVWGESKGSAALSAFYRFMFDENDKRRDFVNGLWGYTTNEVTLAQDSCVFTANYTVTNNKWSKLWANAGQFTNISTGSTGINFPYMRYADVLLMYAEATNELNGPTAEAQEALRQVRARAFDDQAAVKAYIAQASASKETFLKAVLDERKFEFAGENSRWRDLVRNNIYNREVVYSFLRYYTVSMNEGCSTVTEFDDDLREHDGIFDEEGNSYLDVLPVDIYFHILPQDQKGAWRVADSDIYAYPYPNTTMDMLYIYNPYKAVAKPANSLTALETNKWGQTVTWLETSSPMYSWESNQEPTNQCRYSFYGYIRYNLAGEVVLVKDGAEQPVSWTAVPEASQLPPVRYILPYPETAIQRSAGAYKNYYGYQN